jgi:hypothetical protein
MHLRNDDNRPFWITKAVINVNTQPLTFKKLTKVGMVRSLSMEGWENIDSIMPT